MVNLDFKVIGVNDVTDDPTVRFRCVTSDDDKLYIGTDRSSEGSADIWEYSNESYTKITDTLEGKGFKSIGDLIVDDGVLYAGVGDGFTNSVNYSGQVWVNNSIKWSEIGLGAGSAVNYATNFIRSMVKVGDDIYAGGSKYDLFKISSSGFTPVLTFNDNFSASMPPEYRIADNLSKLENWVDLETDGSAVYGSIIPTSSVQALMAYVDNSILNLSSIVKYDPVANTLVDFSPPVVFANGGHRMVSKLHYDDGYLYAGTYNSYSGTELWRSPVISGGSWTQINDGGFGDATNFMITDMQTIDGHIVVSVTSSKGPSIWVYDKSDGSWTKQTITSDTIYETYRIQRLGTVNYLVGQNPQYMVQTRPEETIMEAEEMYQELIPHLMDNSLHAFPLEDGNYRFIGNQGPKILVTEGTLQDPFSTKISPLNDMTSAIDASARTWCSPYDQYNIGASSSNFSSMYFTELQDKKLSFTRSKMADPASDLLNGSGYQFRVEDDLGNFLENVPASAVASYAGLNSYINENHSGITLYHPNGLMYDEEEDLLIGTLYVEDGKWGKAGPPSSNPTDACGKDEQYWLRGGWYHMRSLRLIASNDKGVTFSDCGSLVTGPSGARINPNDVTSPSAQIGDNQVVGVGNGSLIRRADPDTGEDYLYVYFIRFRTSLDGPQQGIGAARAPYSSVIDYALNGSAYPFSAYYEGAWDQVVTSERLTDGSSIDLFPSNTYLRDVGPYSYVDQGVAYVHKESNHVAMAGLGPVHILDAYLAAADIKSYQTAYYSKDGLNFGYPQRLNNADTEFRSDGTTIVAHKYPGFVGPDTYKGEWGNTVETYGLGYTDDYGSYANLDGFWQTARIKSTSLSAPSIESTDRSFDVGRYIRAFNSKYAIDRCQLPGIYAAMHRIKERQKYLTSDLTVGIPGIQEDINELAPFSSTPSVASAISILEDRLANWTSAVTVSYVNSATNGDIEFIVDPGDNQKNLYNFPKNVDNYYGFEFGRDLHRLYRIYQQKFQWHRLSPDVQNLDGANIFSHAFGPLLYNHNLNELGIESDLVASSFSNPDKLTVDSAAFTGTASFAASTDDSMYLDVPERVSSGIVDGVELVLTSGVSESSFSVLKIPGTQRQLFEDDFLFDKTFVLMRSGSESAARMRFDISKYAAEPSRPISNNFLLPDHEFKISLESLVSQDSGETVGGRGVGVWIHTKPESGKMWTYTPEGVWIQHDQLVTREQMMRVYAHLNSKPLETRSAGSTNYATDYACLDQVATTRQSPIMGFSSTDFDNFNISFNTDNRKLRIPRDYQREYGQLHRENQKYVIEVFMSPGAQPEEFLLVNKLEVQDLTLKTLSEIFAAGTLNNPLSRLSDYPKKCLEYRVELSKEDLFDVFKHFNNIAGKNAATAYASRDKDKTATIMESQGGSRVDYRMSFTMLDGSDTNPTNTRNRITFAASGNFLSEMRIQM